MRIECLFAYLDIPYSPRLYRLQIHQHVHLNVDAARRWAGLRAADDPLARQEPHRIGG